MFFCEYLGRCGGCRVAGSTHDEKLASVRGVFKEVRFTYAPEARVRDRADLVWEKREGRMHLGLYGLDSRDVVDIVSCPMMTAPLEKFMQEFRLRPPPITKGSVRLRVSPKGERGVWLDFANSDVKTLFEEKEYLKWLSAIAFVEIGQRRKALIWKDGQPKLTDPVLNPWFESYDADGRPIQLYGPVGGFSQTGFAANKALIAAVADAVANAEKRVSLTGWLELFCGNGNFTVALASRGHKMEAVEMDELAIRGLKLSNPAIPVHRADVYLKTKSLPPIEKRGLLVDPPRAGLRETLTLIENGEKPPAIVYISCFTDVFVKDCAELARMGYAVESLVGVDQFPQSPHAEWVALLTRE
jgi:23S rRNA (uracil1939-C5)-methyltransferase